MDHHHHHHHHDMKMTSTESNPASTSTVSEQLAQHHDHHHHHDQHTMTFQFWTTSKLLVETWPLDSLLGLVAAMVCSALLSVVYEGSKFYYHIGKVLHHKRFDRWRGTLVAHYVSRMWKALAYMIHFLIGYVLMLCSMTYNLWVLIAICLGSGIGYFFLLPLIQHVLHRNTDDEARAPSDNIPSLISYRIKPGKSNNITSRYSKLESDEDLSGSRSNILFQQISNLKVQVTRETVL